MKVINFEKTIAGAPVGVVTKREWYKLPKLGIVGDALQGFVNYTVRKYQGKRVIMLAGEYGREPYRLFNID